MAFCRLPWQGVMVTPTGDFRLCALTNSLTKNQGIAFDENNKIMNIMTHSFKDGLNGKWHRAVRLHDITNDGAWHDICSCCQDRETATGGDSKHVAASRRQSMERRNPSTEPVNPHSYKQADVDENGYVNWNPTTLDLRFGNLCNLKCVQCGPNYSNQWYEDWVNFSGSNFYYSFGRRQIQLKRNEHGKLHNPREVRWWETDTWWEKFDEILPTLEHIYLTGGEPMIVPAHNQLLDRIIASGRAKDIYLDYDTNLTVVNDRIASQWQHFKHVEIAGSLDATHENYELIRNGGSWETFANNVKRIKEYEKDGVVKLYRLTSCAQLSTLHNILRTEQWVLEQGVPFQARFVDTPLRHSIATLSESAKKELIEYFGQHSTETSDLIKNYLIDHLDSKHENPNSVLEYVKFMNYLDTSRNTQWKITLQETWDMLKRHYPGVVAL